MSWLLREKARLEEEEREKALERQKEREEWRKIHDRSNKRLRNFIKSHFEDLPVEIIIDDKQNTAKIQYQGKLLVEFYFHYGSHTDSEGYPTGTYYENDTMKLVQAHTSKYGTKYEAGTGTHHGINKQELAKYLLQYIKI